LWQPVRLAEWSKA